MTAHILVVDDEPSVRRALRRILESEGHEVGEAEDGQQAMAMFRSRRPDVVLLDLYMPEVDGMEAAIRIKAEYPDAKVIAMSGGGWMEKETLLSDVAAVGAEATLAKPFTPEEVLEAIDQALADRPA